MDGRQRYSLMELEASQAGCVRMSERRGVRRGTTGRCQWWVQLIGEAKTLVLGVGLKFHYTCEIYEHVIRTVLFPLGYRSYTVAPVFPRDLLQGTGA